LDVVPSGRMGNRLLDLCICKGRMIPRFGTDFAELIDGWNIRESDLSFGTDVLKYLGVRKDRWGGGSERQSNPAEESASLNHCLTDMALLFPVFNFAFEMFHTHFYALPLDVAGREKPVLPTHVRSFYAVRDQIENVVLIQYYNHL
jgi:hypothetical protein